MDAAVILAEGEERHVKAEDLVFIRNRNGNEIMAVCRGGLGYNENMRTGRYSPGVAYARIGRHPSNPKEFYAFGLSVIADVSNNILKENKMSIKDMATRISEEKGFTYRRLYKECLSVKRALRSSGEVS